MSSEIAAKTKGVVQNVVTELKDEGKILAKTGGTALTSFAWLWPVRGLLYTIAHPQIIFSVRAVLAKSLVSSAVVSVVLAIFTYIPQAALLSIVAGPFGPILAVFLVGAESIFLLTFFAKPLFLEPTLQHVFDAALIAQGQRGLVKDGKTKHSAVAATGSALLRPLTAFSKDGLLGYLITLPLNLVPVIGTVAFLLINGHNTGPSWHARYFQLKGLDGSQRRSFVEKHQAEYTAFGVGALLFSFIPIVGLVFTFTNTVGAALWAAQIEAQQNILEPQAAPKGASKKAD